MNNLPLQPLVWNKTIYSGGLAIDAQGASVYYRAIIRDGKHIVYWLDHDLVAGSDGDKSFDSWDELKEWVETTHYPHKMQPYVKPMPTWIDVNERLPEEGGKYLVCFGLLKSVANSDVDNFNAKTKQWEFYNKDDLPRVIAWMPIPEFSTMQNLHKGGDCE